MKLYINITRAVIQALQLIFDENKYADKVIEKYCGRILSGALAIAGLSQKQHMILCGGNDSCKTSPKQIQMIIEVAGGWCVLHNIPLPEWKEFQGLNDKKIMQRLEKMNAIRRFRESIPDWLDELGESELQDRWIENFMLLTTKHV
jgi:16S rRNA (cytosine967-C5)-methyltransferase